MIRGGSVNNTTSNLLPRDRPRLSRTAPTAIAAGPSLPEPPLPAAGGGTIRVRRTGAQLALAERPRVAVTSMASHARTWAMTSDRSIAAASKSARAVAIRCQNRRTFSLRSRTCTRPPTRRRTKPRKATGSAVRCGRVLT